MSAVHQARRARNLVPAYRVYEWGRAPDTGPSLRFGNSGRRYLRLLYAGTWGCSAPASRRPHSLPLCWRACTGRRSVASAVLRGLPLTVGDPMIAPVDASTICGNPHPEILSEACRRPSGHEGPHLGAGRYSEWNRRSGMAVIPQKCSWINPVRSLDDHLAAGLQAKKQLIGTAMGSTPVHRTPSRAPDRLAAPLVPLPALDAAAAESVAQRRCPTCSNRLARPTAMSCVACGHRFQRVGPQL